jgi:ribosomal protein L11 methyltransferase
MSGESMLSDLSFRAFVSTSEARARHILDALADSFDSAVVVAAEDRDNQWTVSLHFHEAPNETAVRALVALAAGAEIANALVFDAAPATDWVASSLAGLTPVIAGRFVVHGAHDRGRVPLNRIGIEIEAALAFGTGHHGTTRGCLLALDRLAKRGRRRARVLDLGTGSGVLGIAAARALRGHVLASDNDRLAVTATRANARHNRVGALVEVVRADGLKAPVFTASSAFDLAFANILLGPLKRMAGPLARHVGGCLVLSGLLAAQASAALVIYRAHGFVLERRIPLEGWVTLVLRRRRVAARVRGT